MILQLSELVPFCNKYMWTKHVSHVRFILIYKHNSHCDRVKSLHLKSCKSINLQTIHIYMDSL